VFVSVCVFGFLGYSFGLIRINFLRNNKRTIKSPKMDVVDFLEWSILNLGFPEILDMYFEPRWVHTPLTYRLDTHHIELICKRTRGLFQRNKAFHMYVINNWKQYMGRRNACIVLGYFEAYFNKRQISRWCKEQTPCKELNSYYYGRGIPDNGLNWVLDWMAAGTGHSWSMQSIKRRVIQYDNNQNFETLAWLKDSVRHSRNIRGKWVAGKGCLVFGRRSMLVDEMQSNGYLDENMVPTLKILEIPQIQSMKLHTSDWVCIKSNVGRTLLRRWDKSLVIFRSERTLKTLLAKLGGEYREIDYRTAAQMSVSPTVAHDYTKRNWKDYVRWRKGQPTHDSGTNTMERFIMREGSV
jgi:hypothetical protein